MGMKSALAALAALMLAASAASAGQPVLAGGYQGSPLDAFENISAQVAPPNFSANNPFIRHLPEPAPEEPLPERERNSSGHKVGPKPADNRSAPVLVNITDAGGLNLSSTGVDEYNLSLIFHRPISPTTTTSSMPDYCGRTAVYCSVENDNDADGKADCCAAENNPVCGDCLAECIQKCAQRDVGVRTCFMAKDIGPVCQCGPLPPNCYDMPAATTTTIGVPADASENSVVYVIVGAVLLVGAAVAVKFSHGAGGI